MKMKKRTLWKKSVINLMCLALLIAYFPLGNFTQRIAEANDDVTSTENISESKVREEIVSKRTANSKTYFNPDGTYTSEISQTPIHYKNSRNTWSEIESNLIENTNEENYQNKANSFKAKLDKKIDKDTPLLQIEDQDRSIKMELAPVDNTRKEPAEVTGIVEDNSIQYPEIYKNISLTYTIGADRIKEDILFNEKPSSGFPDKFTYKMDLEGLYAKEAEGVLYLYDKDTNQPIYYFETPYMYDSYKPEDFQTAKEITSIPEEAISYDVKLEHEVIDGQLYLYLIPSKAWLEDPRRIYPITIDPTIVRLQSSNYVQDTSLRSTFPTQTGGNDLELGGGASNGNVIRSLIKFDLSSIPRATHILSSSLNLWFSSTNGSSPVDISLFKVSRDWQENQASWNYAMTSPSVAWTNKGGDYVVSNKLATVKGLTSPTSLDMDMKKWEVPIHIIQNWKDALDPNYGFLFKSDNETTNIYKKFISSEHTFDSKYHPLLVVTYKTNARLGLEDYWDYDAHELVGGTSHANITTGNNVIQYQDVTLLGRANSDLAFTRTYNSKDYEKSAFGYGWSFTGNEKIYLNIRGTANILNYQDSDGTNHEFTYDGGAATYFGPAGSYDTIKKTSSDTYTLYDNYGNQTLFTVKETTTDTDIKVAYIDTQIDRNNNKVKYTYNESNQLVSITTDLGASLNKKLEFNYNTSGFISKLTYDGKEIAFRYNANGYLAYVDILKNTAGERTTTQFIYSDNRLITIKDPNGRKTDFTYENGNLVKLQEPLEVNGVRDPSDRPGTNYTLSIPMKMATITDPEGNTTLFKVNDNYVIERITSPSGIITEYGLDANYNVISEKEIDNGVTKNIRTNKYDGYGNLLTTTDAEGNVTTSTYAAFGNIATYIDSNQKKSTYRYDEKGNLIESIVPINVSDFLTTIYSYNDFGDLLSVESSDGIKETMEIDYLSSIKTVTHKDPHGNLTETKSDFSGNIINTKDGMLRDTAFSYNLKNELEKVTDAKKNSTNYYYDKNGNLLSIINAAGVETNFQYNGQNLIEKETNALEKTTTYKYDKNGIITEIEKPNGDIIEYKQDEITESSIVIANGKVKWKYEKDGDTQVIYDDYNSPKTITYYDNGLIKSISPDSRGILTSYTYNREDYVSNISFPAFKGWNQLEFGKNDSYQTSEINLNSVKLVSLDYDNLGLPASVLFNNDTKIVKEYDRSRLRSEKLELPAGKQFNSFLYNYDANLSISSITSDKGVTTYEYDELNQLVKETLPDGTVISYTYDKVGNRVEKQTKKENQSTKLTSKYNAANQLIQVGLQDYTYDENGNLTFDGERKYKYNEFDQLLEIKSSSDQIIASYNYDEAGRRVYSNDSKGRTFYHYDGESNRVLYEENSKLEVEKAYTYDDRGIPLTMTYKGINYYYLTNYRGDVLAMTDSNGKVVATYTYDAWGNILLQNGELSEINPYRYAGYRYDEDTRLYYLMSRYYSPANGVFITLDPMRGDLRNPISLNGYNYGNNNPVMFIDPDGESAFSVIFNRLKNALLYGLGKWMSFYIPANLYKSLQNGSIAPYILFGEKILNGVKNSIQAYINGKKNFNGLMSDIKKTMASSRSEQQRLLKSAQNQIRKYSSKVAGKILLKSIFTWGDVAIIGYYSIKGYTNNYGWGRAWR